MTPLQIRREQLGEAIWEHLKEFGARDWRRVRQNFPDVPHTTFWRAVKEEKLEFERSRLALAFHSPQPELIENATRYGSLTVGELVAEYQTEVLSTLRTGKSRSRSLDLIVGPLAHITCMELSAADIEPVVAELALRAPTHANRALAYLSAVCRWALDRGAMLENPARWIGPPTAETPRDRILSLDELVEVWQAAGALGYPFGPAIRLLILTATRRQDVAEMRSERLFRDGDGNLNWRILERNHGEQFEFVVPLPLFAGSLIYSVASSNARQSGLIFTGTGSTPISGWSHAKRRLDGLIHARRIERHGAQAEPMPPWRLNDFRGAFYEIFLAQIGASESDLGRCLNRMAQSTKSSERLFARDPSDLEMRREMMTEWAELLHNAISEATVRS